MKYESLIEDGKLDTKSEKDVENLALTSQIQELKIVFAKQSTYQDINKNINVGNTRLNNSGNTWKTTAPTSGDSWMKENNGRTFHWCKWHEYWTATHNSKNCRIQQNTPTNKTNSTKSSDEKPLKINLASLDSDNMTDDIFDMTASVETDHHIASDEIDRMFDVNTINCTEVKNSTSDVSEQL